MDLDEFLTSIFPTPEKADIATPRRLLEYSTLQEHIDEILNQFEGIPQPEQDQRERAMNDGRIGPDVVGIEKSSLCGSMNIKDSIELESQSNFSSVRSNICVCKGKWMYEILLGSKGIMQLGWATLNCKFTNEEGVGDTPDSFAYDGHRIRKWNVSTAKYGEEWMAGDVIGCSIDLNEGTISYRRNGKCLGVAFDNVRYGPGLAYFPAVSLSYGESCQLNFGGYPFKFPMEGFLPLQDPPRSNIAKGRELINCLDRLLPSPDRIPCLPPSLHGRSDTLSFLTTSHVFEKLGPLLMKGYIVEDVLLPFLLKSCSGENPLDDQPGVFKILDLMWACMEDFELEPCLEHLLFALIKAYWYQPVTLDFGHQSHCLSLALSILRHHKSRQQWIECKIFPQKFSYFMHIRPPDDDILNAAFPVVWWECEKDTVMSQTKDKDKAEYLEACQRLQNKVQVLEDVQVEMCKILLEDDDHPAQGSKSTREIFLSKFRKYLQESMLTTLNLQPSTACGGPVITCFYHRLIQALRYHWDKAYSGMSSSARASQDAYVPLHIFFDNSVHYWDMSRLGGVISHLRKAYDTTVKEELNKKSSSAFGSDALSEEDYQLDPSLVKMLDDVITLYHIAVHKQLSKVRAVRDSMQQNIKALEDTETRIKLCPPEREDVLTELRRSKSVFVEETTNCARHMAWVSTLIFTKSKQEDIHWMLLCILKSISRGARQGPMFEFTPEFYIDVAINAFHGLRNYFHPTTKFSDLPDATGTLDSMALLLCNHFTDRRIINPDLRDVIIQALAAFVCYPDSLTAVERMPNDLLENLVRSLMGAYDKRSWVQTTWILVRIWKGCGFAFRYTSSQDIFTSAFPEQGHLRASLQPPCSSKVLQNLISQLCLSDVKLADEFLNGVLNQLNWAFSEFIEMLQEIQQATNRLEISLEKRQLRTCAVCFDLTVGLLRVLEMVSTVTPQVFTDWKMQSSELHIARLFQLLTQVLNRITACSNLFDNVTRLHLPGLETVDRFPVLGAVAGILITLLMHGTKESQERATSALLADPGFTIESVEFLVGGKSAIPGKLTTLCFSFNTLMNKDVSLVEVQEVEELVRYLEQQSLEVQLHKQESVDVEELCPICYAMKISVRFIPCTHVSCRSCITRHLMNNKECFFCKDFVEKLEDIHGPSSQDVPPKQH